MFSVSPFCFMFNVQCLMLLLLAPYFFLPHPTRPDTKETKDTKHTKPLRGHTEGWTDLCVPPEELRPAFSLMNGQCFNWRQAAGDCWVGVLGGEVIAIRCEHSRPSSDSNALESSVVSFAICISRHFTFHISYFLGTTKRSRENVSPGTRCCSSLANWMITGR